MAHDSFPKILFNGGGELTFKGDDLPSCETTIDTVPYILLSSGGLSDTLDTAVDASNETEEGGVATYTAHCCSHCRPVRRRGAWSQLAAVLWVGSRN